MCTVCVSYLVVDWIFMNYPNCPFPSNQRLFAELNPRRPFKSSKSVVSSGPFYDTPQKNAKDTLQYIFQGY